MTSAIQLQLGGKNLEFPTEEQLRCFLLDAAEYFHRQTGMPRTTISAFALNDPAFSPTDASRQEHQDPHF